MTILAVLVALVPGVWGLLMLARTHPKRCRVFGLPDHDMASKRWIAHGACFLPPLQLMTTGNVAALVTWLGFMTVAGWAVATLRPDQWTDARHRTAWFVKKLREKLFMTL